MKLKFKILIASLLVIGGAGAGCGITLGVAENAAKQSLWYGKYIDILCLAVQSELNALRVDYLEDRESFTLWIKADDYLLRFKPKRLALCAYCWAEANQ